MHKFDDVHCPCCGGDIYADSIGLNRFLWRCRKCPWEKVYD